MAQATRPPRGGEAGARTGADQLLGEVLAVLGVDHHVAAELVPVKGVKGRGRKKPDV